MWAVSSSPLSAYAYAKDREQPVCVSASMDERAESNPTLRRGGGDDDGDETDDKDDGEADDKDDSDDEGDKDEDDDEDGSDDDEDDEDDDGGGGRERFAPRMRRECRDSSGLDNTASRIEATLPACGGQVSMGTCMYACVYVSIHAYTWADVCMHAH